MNGNSTTNRFSVKKSGSPSKHQDKTNLIGDTHDDEVVVVSAPSESQRYQNSSGGDGGGVGGANPMLSGGQNYGSVHNNGHEKKIKRFFSRRTSGKKIRALAILQI